VLLGRIKNVKKILEAAVSMSALSEEQSDSMAAWRTKGQNQNKNQREDNTPPPPIAILLVLRKPKNQF
jgi:hypothetical protein